MILKLVKMAILLPEADLGCCNIQDGALCDNYYHKAPLTIITKRSNLDVAAALDRPLITVYFINWMIYSFGKINY